MAQEARTAEQHGATERVRRLREESLNTQPRLYMERAVLETEAYRKYEGTVSVPELRALTLRHFFAHKTISIHRGEQIGRAHV